MRAMNICKRLPYSFLLFRLHNDKRWFFHCSIPKMCIHIAPKKVDGEWEEDKEMHKGKGSHCCSSQVSWAAGAWDTTSRSGSSPSTHLSPGTASQGVPAKETLSFNRFQAQFPLPLPQPAITPQSQSPSSLHTQLPTEGRSRPFTCMHRLQKKGYKFSF